MQKSFQENPNFGHHGSDKELAKLFTSEIRVLPTLPQIQLKLLNLCNNGSGRIHDIISILRTDPGLCFKILNAVHLSGRKLTVRTDIMGEAVKTAGFDCVFNIIASSSDEMMSTDKWGFMESPYLNRFWQHSLKCALISEKIAEETGYKYPDEAYIAGLLHDIGKLILTAKSSSLPENQFEPGYDTFSEFDSNDNVNEELNHSGMAAFLIDQWSFNPILSDAIRYHHYPVQKINSASGLVKILFAANVLASADSLHKDKSLREAMDIAGINREQAERFVAMSAESVLKTSAFLKINEYSHDGSDSDDAWVWKELLKEFRNFSLTGGMFNNLLGRENRADIVSFCTQGLGVLTGLWNTCVFLYDRELKALIFESGPDNLSSYIPDNLSISMSLKDSLIVSSLLKNIPFDSFTYDEQSGLTVFDEQIIHMMHCEGIFCVPMTASDSLIGTIVIGLNRTEVSDLKDVMPRINMFIRNISSVLHIERERQNRIKRQELSCMESTTAKAKKIVHEINNPLSVIKNYLKVMGLKLSEQDMEPQDELRIINEEINRIANLLKSLTVSDESTLQKNESFNVNTVINDIVKLAKGTLSKQSGIQITLDLDDSMPDIHSVKDNVKQVFINLLNNAIEAIQEEGNILVKTEFLREELNSNNGNNLPASKGKIKISVMDDGPGVSEALKAKLFNPRVTSKKGHQGLGLPVVKKLVDGMNGSIWIENRTDRGTCLKVLLPVSEAGHQ